MFNGTILKFKRPQLHIALEAQTPRGRSADSTSRPPQCPQCLEAVLRDVCRAVVPGGRPRLRDLQGGVSPDGGGATCRHVGLPSAARLLLACWLCVAFCYSGVPLLRTFYKVRACGGPALSKLAGATFPTALAHLVSPCHSQSF